MYEPVDRLRAFVSYSHKDYEQYAVPLVSKLRGLAKGYALYPPGEGTFFDRDSIAPGSNWDRTIRRELEEADLFLILVSDNFNASTYCCEVELARILERCTNDPKLILLPILLHDVDLRTVRATARPELESLQGVDVCPKAVRDGASVVVPWREWSDHQLALDAIGREVTRLLRPLELVDGSRSKGSAAEERSDELALSASFLPYLCDRDLQDTSVEDMIDRQLRKTGETLRPALLVLSGSDPDCPEQYVQRLSIDTVPKSLGLATLMRKSASEPASDLIKPLRWPDEEIAKPERLRAHFIRQLAREYAGLDVAADIQALIARHRNGGRFRFYVMHVPSEHSSRHVGRALTTLAEMLSSWPDLARSNGLFFVALIAPRPIGGGLDNVRRRVAAFDCVSHAWLPQLLAIETHHARRWSLNLAAHGKSLPDDFISRVFRDQPALPMRAFADGARALLTSLRP